MFEMVISRQELITPLLIVANAVDKKQATPILSNILLRLTADTLWLTATDLEIEISARVPCQLNSQQGTITIPAKKWVDIIRSLDEKSNPTITLGQNLITIREGRSQFKISTLAADNYPNFKDEPAEFEFSFSREKFIHLLQATNFAISQQDVRVFLNGLFFEIDARSMTAVAMDGHRMAVYRLDGDFVDGLHRFLLPRKSVQEILKLLGSVEDETISIAVGKNHFKLSSAQYTLYSKLIDSRFPVYSKAIPRQQDKQIVIDCDLLKKALLRIIILAPEKSRGVSLHIQNDLLTLVTNNQEREEAMESIPAQSEIQDLKIGMNASYLIDFLNHTRSPLIRLSMKDADSSILVEPHDNDNYQYVLMPMKL